MEDMILERTDDSHVSGSTLFQANKSNLSHFFQRIKLLSYTFPSKLRLEIYTFP